MKLFENIYYFLKSPFMRVWETDKRLDILLIYLEEIGIKEYRQLIKEQEVFIIFNDSTELRFNCIEGFSWMSYGKILFSNGKKISWSGRLPSRKVTVKFYNYFISERKKSENINFDDYLPLTHQRKIKLKKLN